MTKSIFVLTTQQLFWFVKKFNQSVPGSSGLDLGVYCNHLLVLPPAQNHPHHLGGFTGRKIFYIYKNCFHEKFFVEDRDWAEKNPADAGLSRLAFHIASCIVHKDLFHNTFHITSCKVHKDLFLMLKLQNSFYSYICSWSIFHWLSHPLQTSTSTGSWQVLFTPSGSCQVCQWSIKIQLEYA